MKIAIARHQLDATSNLDRVKKAWFYEHGSIKDTGEVELFLEITHANQMLYKELLELGVEVRNVD